MREQEKLAYQRMVDAGVSEARALELRIRFMHHPIVSMRKSLSDEDVKMVVAQLDANDADIFRARKLAGNVRPPGILGGFGNSENAPGIIFDMEHKGERE